MRQFKLRLRDGTILAVDQAGLRTWLIDDRAMVQPVGTRGWRPLKEIVAYLAANPAPAPRPEPAAEPPRAARTLADHEIPAVPFQEPSLAPTADAVAPARAERATAPAPAPAAPGPAAAPPPAAASRVAAVPSAPARPAASPAAKPPSPPQAKAKAEPAPAAKPAAPPPAARAAAAPTPRPAAAPLIPEAPPEPDPVRLEDLPLIPLKPLDEPAGERGSVRVADASDAAEDSGLADALALVIQREVAEGHAVVLSEDDLEEIDLVDEEGAAAGPAAQPLPPLAAAISSGLQHAAGWVGTAVSNVRARAAAGHPAHASQAAAPPVPIAELPSIPLAAPPAPASKRNVRAMALAAGVAVLVVAAGFGVRWLRAGTDTGSAAAPAPPPTLPPAPAAPARAPEVEAAIAKLPHLAPDTVQLLFDTSPFAAPESADVFRRAWQVQRRGLAALSSEEAQELRVLERAMLVRLGPAERERVLAYERMRTHRDLAPGEDGRVAGLVARGVRGLPPEQRERLQVLVAKAIAAGVAADAAAAPAASASAR